MKTKCSYCNQTIYLGAEFEEFTCDGCGCVMWIVVAYRLPIALDAIEKRAALCAEATLPGDDIRALVKLAKDGARP